MFYSKKIKRSLFYICMSFLLVASYGEIEKLQAEKAKSLEKKPSKKEDRKRRANEGIIGAIMGSKMGSCWANLSKETGVKQVAWKKETI